MQKTRLKTAALGNTGLEISRVGFGAWAIGGGGWGFGWGPQDDTGWRPARHRALAAGVNWIHSAAGDGLGHSEELGWRVPGGPPSRHRPPVFTKGGAGGAQCAPQQ